MSLARRLGILVFCAVPAIVGGGIIFALFDNYVAVGVYELVLLFIAGGFASR
jgi:hypothetical protein